MGNSHRKYDGLWVITDCGQLMVSPVEQDKSPNSMAFLLSPLVDGWAYYLIYASIFAAFLTLICVSLQLWLILAQIGTHYLTFFSLKILPADVICCIFLVKQ